MTVRAKNHDMQASAHRAFRRAVRSGAITKASECSVCGSRETLCGHHDDYAKPLDVRWLCRPCHMATHYKHGAAFLKASAERRAAHARIAEVFWAEGPAAAVKYELSLLAADGAR